MLEKLLELIGKLAETYVLTFLLLFVIGALLLATAATGGWPQFDIAVPEPLWRDIIGVCGVILLLAAMAFAFIERRIRPNLPSKEMGGVSIDDPADGIHVLVPCSVIGKCKVLPRGIQLWLFTIGGQGKSLRFYPQDEIRVKPDHSWRTELRATNFKDGDKRKFAIFLVGESGQALIHHFKAAGEAIKAIEPKDFTRPWPGITLLTSDIVQSTDVREVTISRPKSS